MILFLISFVASWTGSTRLLGLFCCFLPFQMKGRKRNPAAPEKRLYASLGIPVFALYIHAGNTLELFALFCFYASHP
jgi:hypothetical protein